MAANGSEVTQISSVSAVGNSAKVLRVSRVHSCLAGRLCPCVMTGKERILLQMRCGLGSCGKEITAVLMLQSTSNLNLILQELFLLL